MVKGLMQLDWSCTLCNRPDPEEPADESFNISTPFQVTEATHEESLPLETSTLDDVESEDLPTSYQEVSQGSKRGNRKLVYSNGSSYTVLKLRCTDTRVFWRCIKRGKALNCPATTIQTGNTEGKKQHLHPGQPGILTTVKIRAEALSQAKENVFTVSAPRIASDIVQDLADTAQPEHSRPKVPT
ncbi:uncharacterized protein LOC117340742 [Pecten maximus]|uniref:uncharacterized protein LOC117340742 n=1 Tax=Pecten maximus TaxID=6579 RepID=UPI00145862D2|nr:uncharacterized protein LOC117340742 [Pecten maximus]